MADVRRDAYLLLSADVCHANEPALGPDDFLTEPVRRDLNDVAGPEVPRHCPHRLRDEAAEQGEKGGHNGKSFRKMSTGRSAGMPEDASSALRAALPEDRRSPAETA
ncbi:hypothetical protein AB0A98_22400 [Streptomyces chrestomyceticus]|uniref:hypothetical protein n=1 Tax=Streptomyces chrestomyceticus TaxID=68185 RepID=UPI0033E76B93